MRSCRFACFNNHRLHPPFRQRTNTGIRSSTINSPHNLLVPPSHQLSTILRYTTFTAIALFHRSIRHARRSRVLHYSHLPPPNAISSSTADNPYSVQRAPYPAKHEVVALGHESVIHAQHYDPRVASAHTSNARRHWPRSDEKYLQY